MHIEIVVGKPNGTIVLARLLFKENLKVLPKIRLRHILEILLMKGGGNTKRISIDLQINLILRSTPFD